MKKLVSLIAALALVLGLSAAVSANLSQSQASGTTEVTYSIDSTYTITIPTTVNINNDAKTCTSAVNITSMKIASDEKLTVTIASSNGFKLKNGNRTIQYIIKKTDSSGDEISSSNSTILSLASDASESKLSQTLWFNIPSDTTDLPAGTYSDTLTFTSAIVNN